MTRLRSMSRAQKWAATIFAGASVAGLAGASAAALGGLSSNSLGSDDTIVASCDSDGIGVTYSTSYSAAQQEYVVSAVNFTGVDASCDAKAASVTLRDGATALGTTNAASITVAANAFSITLGTAVAAGDVDGLSLIISG